MAYARTQRFKRDARAFSISYSPAMDKTTLYESTFAPPHRKSVSARDRFGKTEPGARNGLYCVHAPSRGGPDFGTYNFASSFAKPRPNLSRSMRVVISRTATGDFMPVEAQKARRGQEDIWHRHRSTLGRPAEASCCNKRAAACSSRLREGIDEDALLQLPAFVSSRCASLASADVRHVHPPAARARRLRYTRMRERRLSGDAMSARYRYDSALTCIML